jgi:membrane-associated protein
VEWIKELIDLVIHLDVHLNELIRDHGAWIYLLLFVIVFCETGLVIAPFLPGDSLLFVAGALAASGSLEVGWLIVLLSLAAIAGDSVNYWMGSYVGPRAFGGNIRLLKKKYLYRTQEFYEKHGGKTIVIARFVPIIRTFAPFVAGVGAMRYGRFIVYNVTGGIAWVVFFTLIGYFFGKIPAVKNNFGYVILVIVVTSAIPVVAELVRGRLRSRWAQRI